MLIRGYHVFPPDNLGLTVLKFLGVALQCVRKFGVPKNFIHDRGYHNFPSKIFGLTVPKYFIGEHMRVLEEIFYQKLSCIGRGASRFCRNFLSHRTETKIFVKDLSRFPENFWYRKNLWIRGGISRFSIEIFMSRSTEKIRGHPFNVSENLGYRKNLIIIGGITFYRQYFFGLTVPNFHRRTLSRFRRNLLSKTFMHRKGGITILSKYFVSQERNKNLCKGPLPFSRKFLVSKKFMD